MAVGGSKFLLEKTWKASASTTTTFNTPGNIVIPYGRSNIVVTGRGGTGIGSAPSTIAGYNPTVPGNLIYNPVSGGNYSFSYSPTPGYTEYNPPSGGNYAGGNPPSGGNFGGYNSPQPGNPNYNAGTSGVSMVQNQTTWYYNNLNGAYYYAGSYTFPASFNPSCPSPFTGFVFGADSLYYETNFSCTPVSGGGNIANYNPNSPGTAFFNPYIEGNATYNPITPGDPYYVPYQPGVDVYNPVSGGNFAGGNPAVPGNANYNAGTGPVPGTPTNVLGVTMPGGNPGQEASVVPPTTINRYQFPDGTTYPVTVPTGSYVIVQIT